MRIRLITVFILLLWVSGCSLENRVWENPYDPRSDRSLWTPVNFKATQLDTNRIQLTWERKGLDFDGFKIDKRNGSNDWIERVAVVGDSTLIWIDTSLDLKEIVQNPAPITYRLTAFAGENFSNSVLTKITPLLSAPPAAVDVDSVYYFIGAQGDTMVVTWTPTAEGDFKAYYLYHRIEDGDTSKIATLTDINTNRYTLTGFDPTLTNTFVIGVLDTTGRETKGKGKSSRIDPPPTAVTLDSITYGEGHFSLRWGKSPDSDFKQYVIQEVDSAGETVIAEKETISIQTDTNTTVVTGEDEIHYYRIQVYDHWDQVVASDFRRGSSYQSIVIQTTLDTINGSNIQIKNHNTLIKEITGVQAIKPVWIQGGKKIFAFVAGGAGLVVNADGSNLQIVPGIGGTGQPIFINFDSDDKKAILSTDQGFLCTWEEVDSTHFLYNQLTSVENNQLYGEANVIAGGGYICWKDSNQANNNRGVRNLYRLDSNGSIAAVIKEATDFNKYINPRLSPDGSKLVYVLVGTGMYLSDKDGNNESFVTDFIPDESWYFKNLRWSPNSTQILFWKDNKIYTFTAELPFTGQVEFVHHGINARWSADGNAIIFFNDGEWLIMDLGSGNVTTYYSGGWAQIQPRQ